MLPYASFSAITAPIRLQGPLKEEGTGRVEVFYKGQWGTICDQNLRWRRKRGVRWGIKDARVVCRQLGFYDAVSTLQRSEVLPGSGKIWLGNVACNGKEQSIASCSHNGWGIVHGCTHDNDVRVECSMRGNYSK